MKKLISNISWRGFATSAALCVASASALAATERHVYLLTESDSYSEIAPIKQVLNGLEGSRFERGDLAFSYNKIELGERRGPWEVSLFYRYDYFLEFSGDAAEVAYADKNDQELDKQRRYYLQIEPNHVRAKGIGAAYNFTMTPEIDLRLRANFLRGEALTDGSLEGYVTPFNDRVEGDVSLDYNYSRDTLLKREEERVRGNGLSLDIDLRWAPNADWLLEFSGRDIVSGIWWRDVTYTTATATSNTISYKPDGSIDAKPAVSGKESYRNHRQTLASRLRLSAAYNYSQRISANIALQSYNNYLFPQLGVAWKRAGGRWSSHYDIKRQAVSLGYEGRQFSIGLRADRPSLSKAKAFSLDLSYRLPL